MNLKVDVIESEEGPALGGAMLAAVGCGEYPDVETIAEKLVKVVDTIEPEPELVAKYEERYQQFRKLYPAVKGLFQINSLFIVFEEISATFFPQNLSYVWRNQLLQWQQSSQHSLCWTAVTFPDHCTDLRM